MSTLIKQFPDQPKEETNDLEIYKQAKAEYLEDTETMFHDEFKRSLGF
ncbi:hypothetical protein ACMZ62_07160 [Streptococcus pluranimalium]